MKIIGLTGGVGTGKSAVSNILKNNNAAIIDADELNHKILKYNKGAYNEIIEAFSEEILDESLEIDRKRLGNIVFNDEQALRKLVKITHKYILLEMRREVERLKKGRYDFIVLDAPLLIESGLHKDADEVWLMAADERVRLERVMKRDNKTEEEVKKIIAVQTDFEELKKYADEIIWNNGSFEELETYILNILGKRS